MHHNAHRYQTQVPCHLLPSERINDFCSFFPFWVREWNKLDNTIQDTESIKQFKSMLKIFFSLNERSLFSIYDPLGGKLLTRLRLQFIHLNEQKLHHNSKDCKSPMCDCGAEAETTRRFLIDVSIKNFNEEFSNWCLIIWLSRFKDSKNKQILLHTICYIQATKRFDRPLIDQC